MFPCKQDSRRFGARQFVISLHTICTLLLKNVDTVGLRGLYQSHIPRSKSQPRTGQHVRGFALGDRLCQKKEYGAKDAALRSTVF